MARSKEWHLEQNRLQDLDLHKTFRAASAWTPARDVLATLMWAVQYDTPYGWVTESAFASQNQSRARLAEIQGKNPTIRFRILERQLEV